MSGSVFQGTSALLLDGKGRLTVPVRHRDVLLAIADGKLTLTKHPEGCLLVFPRPTWEAFRDKLLTLPIGAEGWRRIYIGSAADVEIDGSSRVLVPPELRAAAGLTKDVLLMGMGHRFELWDAQRYAEHEARTMAAGLPDSLSGIVI